MLLKRHLTWYFYLVDVIYYFYLTKTNLPIYFYSISQSGLWQTKKKIFLCEDLCVFYNVMVWNIYFSGWCFPTFYWLQQKKISCHQLWWQALVNASLISQFWENGISFNFLANSLGSPIVPVANLIAWKWYRTLFNGSGNVVS